MYYTVIIKPGPPLLLLLLSHVQFFVTPQNEVIQASLSITNSQSLLKLMSIKSVMQSNHLILCCPLFSPAFNLCQHQGLFQWVSSSHQVAKVLEFQLQHQSFQWIFRTDFLYNWFQDWFPFQHHSSKASILWHSAFFIVQLSHPLRRWCHQLSGPLSSPSPPAFNLCQHQGLF